MTPEELQFINEGIQARAQGKVRAAAEGDPDKAAQAVKLEQDTGVDSQTIYGNHEAFTRDYKRFLTDRMLERNPGVAAYINAHPMAAIVSKDDFDRMSDYYDKLIAFDKMTYHVTKPASILSGFGYGFGESMSETIQNLQVGTWIGEEFKKAHPYITMAAEIPTYPFESALQVMSGIPKAIFEGIYGASVVGGASESGARKAAREIAGMTEYALQEMVGTGLHGPTGSAITATRLAQEFKTTPREIRKALNAAEPYLRANEMPPLGTHPLWDSVAAENAKREMSIYDALIDSADSTGTLEKSPDLMKLATELKTRSNIYLHWDRLQQLYPEGKVPEPGDGLLGDIPGIAEKLRNAFETESDATIPTSDWISKVAPELRKELHDDIRLRPEGPTLNEIKEIPTVEQAVGEALKAPPEPEPTPVIEDPVARLIRLRDELKERLERPEEPPSEEGNLGESLRAITQKTFEPDLVARSVRWAFFNDRPDIVERGLELARISDPELEARLRTQLDNIEKNRRAMEAIRLETAQRPLGWDFAGGIDKYPTVSQLLLSPEWKRIGEVTLARLPGELTEAETMVRRLIATIFEQLGGPDAGAKLIAAREIRMGTETPYPSRAVYVMPALKGIIKDPTIAVTLGALDPVKSVGHEMIHHLSKYRFITEKEYAQLVAMSEKGWIDKHRIKFRYEGEEHLWAEEGIAEEFGEWLSVRTAMEQAAHPAAKVFQRIADLLFRIRTALKEFFGRDLTIEELFREIESGRVARRAPEGFPEPKYRAKPLPLSIMERELAQRPEKPIEGIEGLEKPEEVVLKGVIPKEQLAKHLRLIGEDSIADKEKLFQDALKEERKRQTAEWKANYAKQYSESLADLKNRPDFRVAAFFRNGVMTGVAGDTKLDFKPKINPDLLTPEQRAKLPHSWMSHFSGLAPDDIATTFGYGTGKEMIDSLISFMDRVGRQKPEAFVERTARAETERRMEMQFGKLNENILREAREHAIGTTKFDLWHEETIRLAELSGQAPPMSKKDFQAQAQLRFNQGISSQVPLIKYTRQLGKLNRDAQAAWTKGDTVEAFRLRQEALRVMAEADFAKRFERERAQFERVLRQHTAREVAGKPPEFTNWIHHIMFRIGRAPKRSPMDLETQIKAYPEQTLEAFSARHSLDGIHHTLESLAEFGVELDSSLPIADFLMELKPDGTPVWQKHLDATTVAEYKKIRDSIQALNVVGRKTYKTIMEGVEADRQAQIDKMVSQMETLGEAWVPRAGDRTQAEKTRMFLQHMRNGLLQMEFVWDRMDKGKRGLFTKTFTDRFAEAGAEYRNLEREFSLKLKALEAFNKGVDLRELIPHDIFYDPLWGLPTEGMPPEAQNRLMNDGSFKRTEFRMIMLNVGNPSNLDKMARAYKVTPEKIMDWVNTHATEQDWGWVEGIAKLLSEMQDLSDKKMMHMTGVMMERLPLGKVQTKFGEKDGWYWPMIYDQARGGGRRPEEQFDPPPMIRYNTVHGWERKRTGYAGPLNFSSEQLPTQFVMRARDIAFRETLADIGKIFRDQRFRDAMTKHMGESYTDLLNPYLQDIAGNRAPTGKAIQAVDKFFSAIQRNTVHVFIGYKLATVMKHTPTAFIQSWGEVGSKYMMQATFDLFRTDKETQMSNRKWLMDGGQIGNLDWKGSAVLNGRLRHFDHVFGAAADAITGRSTFGEKSAHWGAWMVAQSDLLASQALWLAKYREVMDTLKPKAAEDLAVYKVEDAHTEAAIQADQAVRRTHGETAITSRPQFMRTPGLKNLTALYGFFNHIFNRYYRMSWQSIELAKNVKKGEATFADARQLAYAFFLNVVVPGYIEHWVANQLHDEDESWLWATGRTLLHPVFSAVPLLREVFSAVSFGADPGFGIVQGGMKAYTDMIRIAESLGKKGEVQREDVGNIIHHTNNIVGIAARLPATDQLGRWEKFGFNYLNHIERPEDMKEWRRAIQTGTVAEPRRR